MRKNTTSLLLLARTDCGMRFLPLVFFLARIDFVLPFVVAEGTITGGQACGTGVKAMTENPTTVPNSLSGTSRMMSMMMESPSSLIKLMQK